MKRLILFSWLPVLLLSASFLFSEKSSFTQAELKKADFSSLWKELAENEKKGLTRSALKVADKINAKADLENNQGEYIKSLLYQLKFQSWVNEDGQVLAYNHMQRRIEKAGFPLKNVLQSMQAELLLRYYHRHRYKIHKRTKTDSKGKDIRTYTTEELFEQINQLHQAAVVPAEKLQGVKLKQYNKVIYEGSNSEGLRTTLYDLLAHRALSFYRSSESYLAQPAVRFEIREAYAFSDSEQFSKQALKRPAQLSFKYNAVRLLQALTSFHLKTRNRAALVDVDLLRLAYMKRFSLVKNKNTRYQAALEALLAKHKGHEAGARVAHSLALLYNGQGEKYSAFTNKDVKWQKKKAFDLCSEYINKYAESLGGRNCKVLNSNILYKNLSFTVEQVNLPQRAVKVLVKYKNLGKAYGRIINITGDVKNETKELYGRKKAAYYAGLTPLKRFEIKLKLDGDYQQHTTEIALDSLPPGEYVLLLGSDQQLSSKANTVSFRNLHISNIGYSEIKERDNTYRFRFFHREKGHVLKGVQVTTWVRKYGFFSREYYYAKDQVFYSDERGLVTMPPSTDYRRFKMLLRYKGDVLDTGSTYYQGKRYKPYSKSRYSVSFFLDRAIYRPGQVVYFKGILLEKDEKQTRIVKNKAVSVTLRDANYQSVKNKQFTSNEFGTFSGKFTLPVGSLNGSFQLRTSYGSHSFSVEEYKRPRFEVSFDRLKGSYALNKKATISGKAVSFAGVPLDGAKVKYRVVRRVSYPYWYMYWYRAPRTRPVEISKGETKTDSQGAYKVSFTAVPDETADKKQNPVFTYQVYADVTDITGETHSAQQSMRLGYTTMQISEDLPSSVRKQKLLEFKITSQNLNYEWVKARLKLEVVRVNAPGQVLLKRLWQRPDMPALTEKQYRKLFTNDEYTDEATESRWPLGNVVFDKSITTTEEGKVDLSALNKLKEGYYALRINGRDKLGNTIKVIKRFRLFGLKEKGMPFIDPFWVKLVKPEKIKVGKSVSLVWASGHGQASAYLVVKQGNKTLAEKLIQDHQGKFVFTYKIEEEHRGGFDFYLTSVVRNRFYSKREHVSVPYDNKKLSLEVQSFRDKVEPGSKEEYRVVIRGAHKDKVAAEMVAGMYDASLDTFRHNSWYLSTNNYYYSYSNMSGRFFASTSNSANYSSSFNEYVSSPSFSYNRLRWFGFSSYGRYLRYKNGKTRSRPAVADAMTGGRVESANEESDDEGASRGLKKKDRPKPAKKPVTEASNTAAPGADEKEKAQAEPVKIRKNLQETAFFFPHLETNSRGEVIIKFTMPEALTRWKFMGLAHSRDLDVGTITKTLVTQKQLMVTPNVPRFFRQGDTMFFSVKVNSLSEELNEGSAELTMLDAMTMQPMAGVIQSEPSQKFTVKKGKSAVVNFKLQIPDSAQTMAYRIIARTKGYSDGEEAAKPVLSNRMLVTESLPLPVRGQGKSNFEFTKLLKNQSTTLKHHKLTLEFSQNPAWYAVQALPYIMEYPYECAEQVFSRFYANSLARHIVEQKPVIEKVFAKWKGTDALVSNLQKNEDLKRVLLKETPWVLQGKSEAERKKRVALLFDVNRMSRELNQALAKLRKLQTSNGGWPWFAGMPDSRYITQHIVAGLGHLKKLGIARVKSPGIASQLSRAVKYLDERVAEDYQRLLRNKVDLDKKNISSLQYHYFYTRSFFKEVELSEKNKTAYDYYWAQMKKYWLDETYYMRGMIALSLHRSGDNLARGIIKSLKENALYHKELGMYFKYNTGYFWYQAPIESQALLIEAFHEVTADQKSVDDMKIWLLKQKQVQDWKTTKATTEAIYALLVTGGDWLQTGNSVVVKLGDLVIDPETNKQIKAEAGTGYFKTSWPAKQILPNMGRVEVNKSTSGVAWGALYWQYFEDMDKITPHKTPLQLKKDVFVKTYTSTGPLLKKIGGGTRVKLGDLVQVRIELRADRNIEYVHMKDMRAAALEPVNVFSQYKYQDGLGYYQSTKDASTDFFFSWLPKGTYVFEYGLRASQRGDFSNGITSIQSMYAPEFTSHSKGIRLVVGE